MKLYEFFLKHCISIMDTGRLLTFLIPNNHQSRPLAVCLYVINFRKEILFTYIMPYYNSIMFVMSISAPPNLLMI